MVVAICCAVAGVLLCIGLFVYTDRKQSRELDQKYLDTLQSFTLSEQENVALDEFYDALIRVSSLYAHLSDKQRIVLSNDIKFTSKIDALKIERRRFS